MRVHKIQQDCNIVANLQGARRFRRWSKTRNARWYALDSFLALRRTSHSRWGISMLRGERKRKRDDCQLVLRHPTFTYSSVSSSFSLTEFYTLCSLPPRLNLHVVRTVEFVALSRQCAQNAAMKSTNKQLRVRYSHSSFFSLALIAKYCALTGRLRIWNDPTKNWPSPIGPGEKFPDRFSMEFRLQLSAVENFPTSPETPAVI